MRFAVPVFPGSNCDVDCVKAVEEVLEQPVDLVWHTQTDLSVYDAIILPGGFSYGDYLRTGALARFSPVMEGVREAAEKGKLVVGICNGFQILLEAGLLPGAMRRNDHLQFRCDIQLLRVEKRPASLHPGLPGGGDDPHPHRPRRGKLLLRRGNPGGDQAKQSDRLPLRRGKPERFGGRHRRDRQPGGECARHDAPSGTGGPPLDGFGGRSAILHFDAEILEGERCSLSKRPVPGSRVRRGSATGSCTGSWD